MRFLRPAHLPARSTRLPVFKGKRSAAASESDDLFGESQDDSGDLFGEGSSEPAPTHAPPPPRPTDLPPKNPSVPAPSQYDPVARFEDLYQFLHAYLVDKTERKVPRETIWVHLFNIAPTPDHLERAVSLLPKWRDAKHSFTDRHKVNLHFARESQFSPYTRPFLSYFCGYAIVSFICLVITFIFSSRRSWHDMAQPSSRSRPEIALSKTCSQGVRRPAKIRPRPLPTRRSDHPPNAPRPRLTTGSPHVHLTL